LNRIRSRWLESAVGRSLKILPKADRGKILAVAVIQVNLGILDLLGVMAIGLLGALSVSGIQSQEPGEQVNAVLKLLSLSGSTFQTQATILVIVAALLLVGRTVLSIIFTRRILFFLSRRGATISANLIARLLSQPLLTVQARTTQETLFAVTSGVSLITLQILATSIVMVADLSLLLIMTIGLFVVDPTTAISTFLIFSFIGYLLYRFMHVRAGMLGGRNSELSILSSEKIVEVFGSYRESVVRNRRDYYAREIGKIRFALADVSAESSFMPYVSKYIIETSVVLGALLVGAAQFVLQDTAEAVATLAIFLAAGTRIAPAVLRLQQGSIQIRGSLGAAQPTFQLIDSLGKSQLIENNDDTVHIQHEGFRSEIQIQNVSLTYPSKKLPAISGVSLSIQPGESIAFVGLSGAGKTTIIDVLLGVLNPDEGSVFISGLPPLSAVAKWPGAVSYVPQDVMISTGTIRENVALGFPAKYATDELVMSALKVARLDAFVMSLPNGLDTQVGERGAKISGGQRQRLGIARAMFTKPHLLVLDEATSSLDGETEAGISESFQNMRGSTTVVLIAHRLSTVRNADTVVYLADGKITAKGTFDEVRNAVPDFDRQAKLMGL
jgi:ABC-type multidrug transport system fused ATPase/permease subunit